MGNPLEDPECIELWNKMFSGSYELPFPFEVGQIYVGRGVTEILTMPGDSIFCSPEDLYEIFELCQKITFSEAVATATKESLLLAGFTFGLKNIPGVHSFPKKSHAYA